jgi:hypothetical protein
LYYEIPSINRDISDICSLVLTVEARVQTPELLENFEVLEESATVFLPAQKTRLQVVQTHYLTVTKLVLKPGARKTNSSPSVRFQSTGFMVSGTFKVGP